MRAETVKSRKLYPNDMPQRLLAGVCLGGLLLVATPSVSRAATVETRQPPAREVTQTVQEPFLQHFLSQSLQPEAAPPATAATSRATRQGSDSQPLLASPPLAIPEASAQPLTAAATKMVLALGVLVILLIGGAYLVRRYLLQQTPLGKRGQLLRVIARVPLTPKTAVALIEVPGKVLVVGITGTALTALGEVASEAMTPQVQEPDAAVSFAAALDQHTRHLETQPDTDDALLHVPEAIQKKVNGLKRL